MHIEQATKEELETQLQKLEQDYAALAARGLALDLTRGKPGVEQVALSDALDGILDGNFVSDSGVDVRNYGGLEGLAEARAFFGDIIGLPASERVGLWS